MMIPANSIYPAELILLKPMRLVALLLLVIAANIHCPAWALDEGPFADMVNPTVGFRIDKNGSKLPKVKTGRAEWFPPVYSDEGLAVVHALGKYNFFQKMYVDKTGKQAIKSLFADAEPFSEGLAVVRLKGSDKYGYIDKTGKYVIPARYFNAASFSDGAACVMLDEDRFAFIDKTGKVLFEHEYGYHPRYPPRFSEGLLAADIDGKRGYVDKENKVVIKPQFDCALSFHDGLAPAGINVLKAPELSSVAEATKPFKRVFPRFKWGFIDKTGTYIIEPKYDRILANFDHGYAVVAINKKSMPPYSVFTLEDREVISPTRYLKPEIVCQLIDKTGRVLCEYDTIGPLSEGLRYFEKNGYWGYLDEKGAVKIAPVFSLAKSFESGSAWVEKGKIKTTAEKRRDNFMLSDNMNMVHDPDLAQKDIAVIGTVMEKDPENAQALHDRSLLYERLGEFDKAAADYARVIKLLPSERAFQRSAELYKLAKKPALAVESISKAIEQRPKFFDRKLRVERARLYIELKQYQKALPDLDQALKEDVTDTNLLLRAKVLRALNKPALAKADEDKAKKLQAVNRSAYETSLKELHAKSKSSHEFVLGFMKLNAEKQKKELLADEEAYKKASTPEKKADAAWHLGHMIRLEGDSYRGSNPKKAVELYLRAIALTEEAGRLSKEPGNAENMQGWVATAKRSLAPTYVALNQLDKAEETYKDLIKIHSDANNVELRVRALVPLAKIYKQQKRYEEAETCLKKARQALTTSRNGRPHLGESDQLKEVALAYAGVLRSLKRDNEADAQEKEFVELATRDALWNINGSDFDNSDFMFRAEDNLNHGLLKRSLKMLERAKKVSPEMAKRVATFKATRCPNHDIPDDVQATYLVATEAEQKGEYELAERLQQQCLDKDPRFEWPYRNLATMKRNQGKLNEAKDIAMKVNKLNPNYLRGWVELAEIEKACGDLKAARQAANTAFRLDPDNQLAKSIVSELNPKSN